MTSKRIEVDAYRQEVRAHRLGGALAELTPRIALPELAHSFGGIVVVEDMRRSGAPNGARSRAHSDTGIRLDVSDESVRRPCWTTNQKMSPSWPSQMGIRRFRPVRRPTVSNNASPGGPSPSRHASLTGGFTKNFSTG
jgi:hypothetical protein